MISKERQIPFGIRIQTSVVHFLNEFSFFLQSGFCDFQQLIQPLIQSGFVAFEQVAQPGHIDRDYADAARHFGTAEQAVSSFQ